MRQKIKRIWTYVLEQLALFSAELILILIMGIAMLMVFINIGQHLDNPFIETFDTRIIRAVRSLASPRMDTFMKSVTFMNNVEFIAFAFIAVLIYFLFIKPHRWYSIKIPVVCVGSISLNLFLKNYYDRPRPDILNRMVEVRDFSFPSGHAMFSVCFYGLLIYIIWQQVKPKGLRNTLIILTGLLILCIGISRIYLQVHYPSDVIGGYAAGLMWMLLSLGVIREMEKRIRKKVDKPVPEKTA